MRNKLNVQQQGTGYIHTMEYNTTIQNNVSWGISFASNARWKTRKFKVDSGANLSKTTKQIGRILVPLFMLQLKKLYFDSYYGLNVYGPT